MRKTVKKLKIKNALTIADVTTYLWKCINNTAVWTAQCVWPCNTSEPWFLHNRVNQQNLLCNMLAAKTFPLVELAWTPTVRSGLGQSQCTPCHPRAVVSTACYAIYIGCCVWDLIVGRPQSTVNISKHCAQTSLYQFTTVSCFCTNYVSRQTYYVHNKSALS